MRLVDVTDDVNIYTLSTAAAAGCDETCYVCRHSAKKVSVRAADSDVAAIEMIAGSLCRYKANRELNAPHVMTRWLKVLSHRRYNCK